MPSACSLNPRHGAEFLPQLNCDCSREFRTQARRSPRSAGLHADRPQLRFDRGEAGVPNEAVDGLRRHAEQLRGPAMAAITILTGIERRHIGADQLALPRRTLLVCELAGAAARERDRSFAG
jgi:hypothetical protein